MLWSRQIAVKKDLNFLCVVIVVYFHIDKVKSYLCYCLSGIVLPELFCVLVCFVRLILRCLGEPTKLMMQIILAAWTVSLELCQELFLFLYVLVSLLHQVSCCLFRSFINIRSPFFQITEWPMGLKKWQLRGIRKIRQF